MGLPPAVAFAGRDKWIEVAVNLGLVLVGTLLALAAASQLRGWAPLGLLLMVAYTVCAVGATAVLAGAAAATSQLPTLGEATLDGARAEVVSSWTASWWHSAALDLGLAVLGLSLAVAGVTGGADWGPLAAVPGLLGLWFLVRVGLVAAGRRRRPALWLTDDELVVDTPAGRARARRTDLTRVSPRGRRVVIDLDRDATWTWCPRPWRRAVRTRDTLVLDCTEIGHRAQDLASWLSAEVGLSAPAVSSAPRQGRRDRAR